ncbi:AraC family transcriptional regulator ligand-binding domain-containing protein [Mycolicibacterium houstonense]|uniref:AraC family transcriptional regulator ligand-binding domain-containing protein n=1 Tax=Mycolicibacterium houstonense TaxID=146021 RepID=UPI003F980F7E
MDTVYSAPLPRFVLAHSSAAGLDPRRLALEAGVSGQLMSGTDVKVRSVKYLRLWELVEHGLADSDVAVRMAEQCTIGELGLFDYLFSTAPTVGAGMATLCQFAGAVSNNFRMTPDATTDGETEFVAQMSQGEGRRGRELGMQFALAATMVHTRIATETSLSALRVTFRQTPPRNHRGLVDVFGTTKIDFDADVDSITLRTADLELPFRTADPRLAAILHKFAAVTPAPPHPTEWSERVAAALAASLDNGTPSLPFVARQLHVSHRTLQRRLAEAGTTWRKELDRARKLRLEQQATSSRSAQAEALGFADARGVRRAARRWAATV